MLAYTAAAFPAAPAAVARSFTFTFRKFTESLRRRRDFRRNVPLYRSNILKSVGQTPEILLSNNIPQEIQFCAQALQWGEASYFLPDTEDYGISKRILLGGTSTPIRLRISFPIGGLSKNPCAPKSLHLVQRSQRMSRPACPNFDAICSRIVHSPRN